MEGYAFDARLTSVVPIGLVPDGLRVDVSFEGTVTEGPMTGGSLTGIDYLLFRRDGVGVVDVRMLVRLPGGGTAAVTARGYMIAPFEMPPLETLAAPDFQWPDAETALHGCATIQTMESALAAANQTMYGFAGTTNPGRGDMRVRAHSLTSLPLA